MLGHIVLGGRDILRPKIDDTIACPGAAGGHSSTDTAALFPHHNLLGDRHALQQGAGHGAGDSSTDDWNKVMLRTL